MLPITRAIVIQRPSFLAEGGYATITSP